MKRKVVASLLCAAMAVSLLAGCAGGDTSKEDTKTEDTAKEEKKEPEKCICGNTGISPCPEGAAGG